MRVDGKDVKTFTVDSEPGKAKVYEAKAKFGAGEKRSVFMDVYSLMARKHMQRWGTTREHFAMVAAKNSFHGSLNPRAQFRDELTVQQVLDARVVVEPLTLPMCSPIGDGAAAVVLVSERKARDLGLAHPVRIVASELVSGWDFERDGESVGGLAAQRAFEEVVLDMRRANRVRRLAIPADGVVLHSSCLAPPGNEEKHD